MTAYGLLITALALSFGVMLAGSVTKRKGLTYAGAGAFGLVILYVLLIAVGAVQPVDAQAYNQYTGEPMRAGIASSECTQAGETNTTLVITREAAPGLAEGDWIQALVPSTLDQAAPACAGEVEWPAEGNVALTVWADDPQTDAVDGYALGEEYALRVKLAGTAETLPLSFEITEGPTTFDPSASFSVLSDVEVAPVSATRGVRIGFADSVLTIEVPPGTDLETYDTYFEAPLEVAVVTDSLAHLRIQFGYHGVSWVGLQTGPAWRSYTNADAISLHVLAAGLEVPPGYYLEAFGLTGRVSVGASLFIDEVEAVAPDGEPLPVEITRSALNIELRPTFPPGDVTGDGSVNDEDLRAVAWHLIGLADPPEDLEGPILRRIDMNDDGQATLADFALLYGLIF